MTATSPLAPADWQLLDGYVPLLWDRAGGRLHLLVRNPGEEFLYHDRISHGLGDYRLQRGHLGRPGIVRFERRGQRLFLVAVNTAWRSSSAEPAERLAVRQAFPESILWSLRHPGRGGGRAEGRRHRVFSSATGATSPAGSTRSAREATRSTRRARPSPRRAPAPSRSTPRSRASSLSSTRRPERLPFWCGSGRTEGLAALTPDPRAITLRCATASSDCPSRFPAARLRSPAVVLQQRDLQRLRPLAGGAARRPLRDPPPAGEEGPRRRGRQRSGEADHLLHRSRRAGADPHGADGGGEAGGPRPSRPPASPTPSRSNCCRRARTRSTSATTSSAWVPRASRGYSYGQMIWDPRTGEIIQGAVTLTSLRDRHLRTIAEALLSPYEDGGRLSRR